MFKGERGQDHQEADVTTSDLQQKRKGIKGFLKRTFRPELTPEQKREKQVSRYIKMASKQEIVYGNYGLARFYSDLAAKLTKEGEESTDGNNSTP